MEKACFIKSNNGDNDVQKAYIVKKGKVFEEKCSTSEFAIAKNITWKDCSIAYDESKEEFIWFVYHSGKKTSHGNEMYNYPYMTESIQEAVTKNCPQDIKDLSKSEIQADVGGKKIKTLEIPPHLIPSKKRKRDSKQSSNIRISSCPLLLLKTKMSKHCHDVRNFTHKDISTREYNPPRDMFLKRMIPVQGGLFDYVSYYIKKKSKDIGLKKIKGEPLFDQFPEEMKDIIFHMVDKEPEETWEDFHKKLSELILKKKSEGDESMLFKFESFIKTALNLYGNYIL